MGTYSSGFFYIDFINDTVIQFSSGLTGINDAPDNRVSELFVDSKDNLWVGFESGDICFLDREEMSCSPVDCGPLDAFQKSQNIVTGFAEDKNNQIWISTYGRSLLKVSENSFRARQINEIFNTHEFLSIVLWDLQLVNDSLLWIGTDFDGVGVYNILSKKVVYYGEGETEYDINYKSVKTIFQDRDSNIWLGTNGKGINILSPNTRNFLTITNARPESMKLNFSSVRSLLFEDEDNIWVGGYVGLQKLNLETNASEIFFHNISYALCQDNADENLIWIGNEGSGLFLLDKKENILTDIPLWKDLPRVKGSPVSLNGNNIFAVANKNKDYLYICSGAGFHILHKKTYEYEFFPVKDQNSGTGEIISLNGMLIDTDENVWLTSYQGYVFQYIPQQKTFINILDKFEGLPKEISRVNCIFQSTTNQYWLGTSTGLYLLNFKDHSYRRFTVSDGLPNNFVYGILEDEEHNIWLSTNMGICRFNPKDISAVSFSKADGLPCNEFNSAAFAQYGTSRLVFGGISGIVVFNPANVSAYPIPKSPVISDVKIIGDTTQYEYATSYNNTITLRPEQDIFTLYFSSLQYFIAHNNRYAIKINEDSDHWVDLKGERKITITSLPPGEHTIELKVANNSGEWCKTPTKINVKVLPFFSETVYFKLIIAGLVALVVAGIYWWRIREIKKQNEKLERLVDERTNELKHTNLELEVANQTKNKFFSIIAHDLKNPFNSMLGFSDILVKDWDILPEEEKFEFVEIIRNTTEDTFQLLVNLLEWSRIQKKEIKFNPMKLKLNALANDVINQLKGDAFFKNIRITNDIGHEIDVVADQNMIHTVLRNLISNAIKFTPKNGKITLTAEATEAETKCCVSDTGVGIAKEVAEKLFNLQYRNTSKGTEGESGTGLGLVLSQEFIKRHNGNFSVESEPGKGSTFCFIIPKNLS